MMASLLEPSRYPKREYLYGIVILLFAGLAYLPSFHVPFAFDDVTNIVLNPRVQPESLGEVVQALDARGARDRPVAMVTFALNHLWGGSDTWSYHLVNLLIHAATAVVLFTLLSLLTAAPRSPRTLSAARLEFAFAGALLWAVHPVNTQAVTYIVQRMAAMAALFYLAAVVVFVLWRLGRMRGTLAWSSIGALYALAILSKLNAATLPAALLLVDVIFFARVSRHHVIALVAIAAVGAALFAAVAGDQLRFFLVAPPHRDFSGYERLLTQGRVIWHYLSLIVWPDAGRLQLDYDFQVSRGLFSPPSTALALAGLLAITAGAVAIARRYPWCAFGWLFFLLALSVESSFLLLELVFEHRLYLPASLLIPGILAPLHAAASRSGGLRWLQLSVLTIAALLSWQTIERNYEWLDLGGFWASEIERGASVDRAAINAASTYLRKGHPEAALQVLRRAADAGDRSTRFKLIQARGEAYYAKGDYRRALREFRRVTELYPSWTRTAYFAGQSLLQLDNPAPARKLQSQMQSAAPRSPFTIALTAEILRHSGEPARAAETLESHLAELDGASGHETSLVRMHLANTYRELGRYEAAATVYREMVRYDPENWGAWANLYLMLKAGDSKEEAAEIRRFLESRDVNPANWR